MSFLQIFKNKQFKNFRACGAPSDVKLKTLFGNHRREGTPLWRRWKALVGTSWAFRPEIIGLVGKAKGSLFAVLTYYHIRAVRETFKHLKTTGDANKQGSTSNDRC